MLCSATASHRTTRSTSAAGTHLSPRAEFPFGTDEQGRDVLSRVMAGARDVLKVAPLAALLGVLFGVIVGMFMGYFGRLARQRAGPHRRGLPGPAGVLLGLLAVTTLGSSSAVVIGVVAALFTPVVARTVRSAVLAERDLDYVTSAKLRGESSHVRDVQRDPPERQRPDHRRAHRADRLRGVHRRHAVVPRCRSAAAVARLGRTGQRGAFARSAPDIWWTTVFPAAAIASLVIAANLIADSVQSVLEAS